MPLPDCFQMYELIFEVLMPENLFSTLRSRRTLGQTIKLFRYNDLAQNIEQHYEQYLNTPLKDFLLQRKHDGDKIYLRFLNRYGDLTYSRFIINNQVILKQKGIYAFVMPADNGGNVMYVGRCRNSLRQRINRGYGQISARNCYRDGQSTNCHINNLLTINRNNITFWFCSMENDVEIVNSEQELIHKYLPPWNVQLV